MKKLIAVILTLALSTLAVAMAETTDYLGTWYLNEMTMGDASFAPAAMGMDLTMEIKEDGTAVLTAPSEEEAEQAATWTLDGETLTVTVDGEDMTLTLQDGALKGEQGGMGMCFGREKVEAEVYEPAAVVEDAVEADYAGTWKSKYMEMKGNYIQASMFSMDLTAVIDGATMTLDGMYVFENATMESAFSGGALTHEGGDDEMYAGITAQLLEDGTMKLTFDTGDEPLILIMEKAE